MMSNQLLSGKRGIIFGALNSQSLAWKVALQCHNEGAKLVLTNAPMALKLKEIHKLSELIEAPVIPCDVTKTDHISDLLDKSMEYFDGPFDFILHSVGMSINMRKGKSYTNLNYDFSIRTLDISALSLHRILQICFQKNAIREWGSIVALTYIAAHRILPQYSEMADAKSFLESIVRSFGLHYGEHKKVRINSISQSPTHTIAGNGVNGFDKFFHYSDKMSPLGNAPSEALAQYCVSLFSDYTRYVTMQNLYHDGGFSSTGITHKLLDELEISLADPSKKSILELLNKS